MRLLQGVVGREDQPDGWLGFDWRGHVGFGIDLWDGGVFLIDGIWEK